MRSQFTLMMSQTERERLADYATKNSCPTLSAALRHALPKVFCEEVKEGRPLGWRKDHKDQLTV
jgi:hypothetical protein